MLGGLASVIRRLEFVLSRRPFRGRLHQHFGNVT